MIYIVKKDSTLEAFDISKVVAAVNKSANRVLYTFTQTETDAICKYVLDYIDHMDTQRVEIWQMHNIVEAALETVRPEVAKSYRDYRNYKTERCI